MEYVSVSKAADLLGMTPENIYRMIREPKPTFPFVNDGLDGRPHYKIPLAELGKWIEREIEPTRAKLSHLERSHRKIRDYLSS